MIKSTVSITKSDKYITGLHLGSQFIKGSSDILISALQKSFEEVSKKDYTVLKSMLTKAIGDLSTKSGKQAYDSYAIFEKHLFKLFGTEQIPTSIISIVTTSNNTKQFNYSANIRDTLGTRSKNIYSSNSKRIQRNYEVLIASDLLNEHLQAFTKTMQNKYTEYNYREEHVLGFIADAFMQHVASAHADLLAGQIPTNGEKLPHDFRGITPKLAQESRNTTRWYSGGDVIIVDRQGRVLLNTQIKHSTKSRGVVGRLAIAELLTSLQHFRKALDTNNYQEMATKVYKMYSTSAIVNQVDESIIDAGNQLLISTLN